ncbi:S-layer homology domain-containing protein [Leptothermofonsia sp. ETS-13]|uniref:S-layer homology domain-containing protein n=1 Tax=Leptothermofonsia sp. ETS-13 TaxID=3035696 RepID=UPI003B9E981F
MVLRHHRSLTSLVVASCLLLPLSSCANSSLRETLTKAFAADPKLTESAASSSTAATVATSPSPVESTAQLPEDFPAAVRYPGAQLIAVVSGESASPNPPPSTSEVVTRWITSDGGDRVLSFYRKAFQADGWQILNQPEAGTTDGTITARRTDLKVSINVQSGASSANERPAQGNGTTPPATELVIRYSRNPSQSELITGEPAKSNSGLSKLAPFSNTTGLGAAGDSESTQVQTGVGEVSFTDLNKTPAELRQYVEDVARLGILTPALTHRLKQNQAKGGPLFEPNKTITRREYARWLVAANNRLHSDRPTQQIRLGLATSQPAFRDVPKSDPDFPAIQGLAEAGIIPSSLSGDPTAVNFRPNAPLTRESLLLWKVPMDIRQALPHANIDTVKQTWGFQDAAKIDPKALRAVLADHQNGDLSNIRRVFGYTMLFQPKKAMTRAEAAATLWYFGFQGEGQSAQDAAKQ